MEKPAFKFAIENENKRAKADCKITHSIVKETKGKEHMEKGVVKKIKCHRSLRSHIL